MPDASDSATPPAPHAKPNAGVAKTITSVSVAIVVVAIIAFVIYRLAAPASGDPEAAQAALKKNASMLAGELDPAAVAASVCEKADGEDEYTCTPKGADAKQAMTIVFDEENGTVRRRLAGGLDWKPGAISSARAAEAVNADNAARGFPDAAYACATSVRTSPDGSVDGGTTFGMRCYPANQPAGATADQPVSRYLEIREDGTVDRDYVVKSS